MVLLHPGIGDSRVWEPIVPRLAARYRVIRYDARGHGMSPPATAPYTLLDDLIRVLDQGLRRGGPGDAGRLQPGAAPAPSTSPWAQP